jgi:polar amino acid transport system ATP-binding protein/sulfate transport system ATP-binding protein
VTYTLGKRLVSLNNVSQSFDGRPVLAGVSAEVWDIVRPGCITGQIVGILGPSGTGKTVLSRILTGLDAPASGSITIGDQTTPLQAGVVGYVPQNYPIFRHRTVGGNLVVAARQGGASAADAEAKARAYLERFGLADKWSSYPSQLSGGQRQRVAIARQLLCSEHYLVLDEPTTGLDPIMKDRVCQFIQEVASISEENTIFVISHDISSVATIADHLWLLGRTFNEKGESLGSSIRFQYDLVERGIAWEADPTATPGFAPLLREVRAKFGEL